MKKIIWTHIGGDLRARRDGRYVILRGGTTELFLSLETLDNARRLFRRKRVGQGKNPPLLPFTLVVEYPGYVDLLFDKRIEAVVGLWGRPAGSGYSFMDDTRDVAFGFKRRASAVAAARRVKEELSTRTRRIKVSVTGRVWP